RRSCRSEASNRPDVAGVRLCDAAIAVSGGADRGGGGPCARADAPDHRDLPHHRPCVVRPARAALLSLVPAARLDRVRTPSFRDAPKGAGPESMATQQYWEGWILRYTIAHHSSRFRAPRNDDPFWARLFIPAKQIASEFS